MRNSTIAVAMIAATCSLGCDTIPTGSPSADSAEKLLSQLKSFGLEVKKDNFRAPNGTEPWLIQLTEGVDAIRHVSPEGAEDYCWVQKNKNEPRSCTAAGGWSVSWGRDVSPAIAGRLKKL